MRSGQGATQRGDIGWLAVRGERELDRQVEQRAVLSDDVIARLVGATPS